MVLAVSLVTSSSTKHACCLVRQVMMTHERCPEEDAEAILSNLKMEGRCSAHSVYASLENHVMYAPFNRISRHAARRGEVMEEPRTGIANITADARPEVTRWKLGREQGLRCVMHRLGLDSLSILDTMRGNIGSQGSSRGLHGQFAPAFPLIMFCLAAVAHGSCSMKQSYAAFLMRFVQAIQSWYELPPLPQPGECHFDLVSSPRARRKPRHAGE